MLRSLTIQDVVLIEHLDLQLDKGLCVLSGETGAGKSILLDALGLALGSRGDSRLVRMGQTSAVVTACFDLPPQSLAYKILEEHGIKVDSELLLRRVITADGKSRAFINDQPVSIGLLKMIGDELVEIHGQFDRLLEPRYHRDFIDGFAKSQSVLEKVRQRYQDWHRVRTERDDAIKFAQERKLNEAYLRHSLEELALVDPQVGEELALHEKRSRIANSAKIVDITQDISALLDQEKGARFQINKALRLIEKALGLDQARFEKVAKALETTHIELDEAAAQLSELLQECSDGPTQLDEIEKRLIQLRALSRKHQCPADELPALLAKWQQELDLLDNYDLRLNELEKKAEQAKQHFLQEAKELSKIRLEAAKKLDDSIKSELQPLKMENAHFQTEVTPQDESQWGAHGIDQVRFVVATNKGSSTGDLKSIASGGERSRFMLALKVLLSQEGTVPTLIFDEIDSGIGGSTARAVGERLKRLSKDLQILVITHSPQVASMADQHLRVEKNTHSNQTRTNVISLNENERREEIARMLAGDIITPEARAAADQLLMVG